MTLISTGWQNHEFGYICHVPNVVIDNITFTKTISTINVINPALTSTVNPATQTVNPMVAPSYIKVIGNSKGYTYKLSKSDFYKNTTITGVTVE
jgi:hypothetical protein